MSNSCIITPNLVMSCSGSQFVFQRSSLKKVVVKNTSCSIPLGQFSSTMMYEIHETCPGHINVIVVDDRPWDVWSCRWALSDYLIYHFNLLCLLPKTMTKLITLTPKSLHNLALVYLTLTSEAFLMCDGSSIHLSFPDLIQKPQLCVWHFAQARHFWKQNMLWHAIEYI